MGLLTETNAQYYSGQKDFGFLNSTTNSTGELGLDVSSFNTDITSAFDSTGNQITSNSNYSIYYKASSRVTGLTKTVSGSGFVIGTIVSAQGGQGGGLKLKVTSTNGSAVIEEPGNGYVNGDTVELVNRSGTSSFFTLTVSSPSDFIKLSENLSYVQSNQIVLRDPSQFGYIGNFYVQLKQSAINNNYGGYSYITLDDIINNFIVGYVGVGKLISSCKRTDIMFHAKRGLQEFSYDTLKSIKSQELNIPPSLSVAIPQDYINYVKCSWIDEAGAKHIIYPTRVTSNPTELLIQDSDGVPTQNQNEENLEANNSQTDKKWADQSLNEDALVNDYRHPRDEFALGRRYGLQPEEAQVNGKFTINERLGTFSFTSDLVGKLIIFEYISDGLAVDADTKVPKMAEQAMYMHIAHGVLSGRANVPEYVVNRYKRERFSALRNAKIRLSNIKLDEFVQVMRNKSKWIKH